ncbi:unnamed protein product [Tilletia controversa]|uniref:Protein FAF1 n=3 Tax=Tilletia TaxID=13289 RepID=A0A8X7MSB6_9BASI|nr:hypothetical protein CF336_g1897 [Tilletia laevis]KAE8200335.1 hypothetical protein CF328_g2998 [Tilletia controversa]KAE8262284.1 hypothetical protein A4X03_0g2573 [Tilletia caries]KAE8199907.1 hypothetical protein CF335_g4061 [Tilletia laevis]KAE8245980.1 hypothetical protein A4X06_0g5280 [Tilletia controversa]
MKKQAGTASASAKGKRRAEETSEVQGSASVSSRKGKRPASDDEDSEDGKEDNSDDDEDEGKAYGLAVLRQLGIDPASVPSNQSQARKSTTKQKETSQSLPANLKQASSARAPASDNGASTPFPLTSKPSSRVTAQLPVRRQPETIVFDGGAGTSASGSKDEALNTYVDSKAARKAFMSSRIDRISDGASLPGNPNGKGKARAQDDDEAADEKEQKANDRMLSHLLSTTLFAPGADASSTPSTRRNGKPSLDPSKGTLASVLELSSSHEQRKGAVVGRGWGDAQARLQELGKMPNRVREGLKKAAKGRVEKEQDRARELGLVHRSLNKGKRTNMGGTGAIGAVDMALSGVGSSKKPKDRVRGLGLGVGSFGGGKLTISSRDVEKINGPSSSRGRGGGRGGRGGRGGGGRGGGGGGGRGGGGGGPPRKKQRM